MACQKACKQDRDDAWKQRSTYWQSPMHPYIFFTLYLQWPSPKQKSILTRQTSQRVGCNMRWCLGQKCYGCFYRALAVLKLLSAPVYGSRRHILLSCHSPVTITEMMIDNFLKNHQNIVHVSDPDTFLKGVCSSPDFLFDLSQPLLSALQWNSIFVQSPCVLLS